MGYEKPRRPIILEVVMTWLDYNHAIMAILFLIAAFIKLKGRQVEHFFSRFCAGIWYLLTVTIRDMDAEFVRIVSTNIIIIVMLLEALSPVLRRYWRNKK